MSILISGLLGYLLYAPWNWFFEAFLSSDKYGWDLDHSKGFVALGVIVLVLAVRFGKENVEPTESRMDRLRSPALAFFAIFFAVGIFAMPKGRTEPLWGHAEDPAVTAAREREALIVTGPGMELIQLRTRRPILLNTGGLDQLAYVPDSVPGLNEALRSVYGVDLFVPADWTLNAPLIAKSDRYRLYGVSAVPSSG